MAESGQGRRERSGDSSSQGKQHLAPPAFSLESSPEPLSKGKKIISRVNKLFKSPRKHHRKLSESRSEEGASSDNLEELERSSETPLGAQTRHAAHQPRHFSPEPARRTMNASLTVSPLSPLSGREGDTGNHSMTIVGSEPILGATASIRSETTPGTPQHRTTSDSGKWDRSAVDVEATQDVLVALREKMAALDENIQAEMGVSDSNVKDLLSALESNEVTVKSRQNAKKAFERRNRSRSKKLLQLQTKFEQLFQVTLEVQQNGVPKGRDPEEYVKSLVRNLSGPSVKGKRKVLDRVKNVGQKFEGAVDNMKDAAGSISRSLKRPGRSNSMDNLITHFNTKETHSDDGEIGGYTGGAATLPRVSAQTATTQSNSDPSEHHTGTGASIPPAGNLSVLGSRPSGGPGTTKTASSSGCGQGAGQSAGMTNGGAGTTGGADTGSSRERRSTSECSQSNSSMREEVNTLRSQVDDMRLQLDNYNYAVEENQRELRRNYDFYRMGLEEVNSKMERLEELFNESINTLKEEINASGDRLEYRFIDHIRNLRDNVEALRNQQSQIERRYEQQFRSIGSLDSGEAYAPSLFKTRLLDIVIALFNLLVFLLSMIFQLSLRLANMGSLLQRKPILVFGIGGVLLLILVGLLTRDLDVWTLFDAFLAAVTRKNSSASSS